VRQELKLNAEQMLCLTSPVRNQLYAHLRARGQATVAELAKDMGRSPESVHYHVKELLKAGLITEAFRRPAPRKPEVVYESAAKNISLPKPDETPELRAASMHMVLSGLKVVAKGYRNALLQENPRARRYTHVLRTVVTLSEKDAEEFIQRLEDAVRFATEHSTEEGVELQCSTVVFPNS
jgi:predicted ArsR family transcriptional regulator